MTVFLLICGFSFPRNAFLSLYFGAAFVIIHFHRPFWCHKFCLAINTAGLLTVTLFTTPHFQPYFKILNPAW